MIETDKEERKIVKLWKTGKASTTLIIPKKLAKESGLAGLSHVILEKRDDGILLKPLVIDLQHKVIIF